MIIMCPHCGGLNRVPQDKLSANPSCGKCAQPLFIAKPIEMNAAQLTRAVNKTEQLIVVDFWAPWCGPCKMFTPTFSQAAEKFNTQASFVKINTEQEQTIAQEFAIRSIPTLAIFRAGKELDRISGAMDLTQFSQWLSRHI